MATALTLRTAPTVRPNYERKLNPPSHHGVWPHRELVANPPGGPPRAQLHLLRKYRAGKRTAQPRRTNSYLCRLSWHCAIGGAPAVLPVSAEVPHGCVLLRLQGVGLMSLITWCEECTTHPAEVVRTHPTAKRCIQELCTDCYHRVTQSARILAAATNHPERTRA